MNRTNKKIIFLSIGIFLISGVFGCVGQKRMSVIKPEPTCAEALAAGIKAYSDYEIAQLLDSALENKDMDGCWIPLVKQCLDDKREIPARHLVEAVKTLNTNRHEDYFHKAVYRYFAGLAENPEKYRPEDRRFLETYLSFLINTAESNRDKHLGQAKLLCQKLDRNLYARLFE